MDPRIQIRIRIHTKLSWNRNNAFFKASTVTNLCFWRAKEEIEALVAENKALKEELAEMRTQEKRRKLLSPASDKPKLNIKGIIFCFGTYHRVGRVLSFFSSRRNRHVERRWAQFANAIRRRKGIHILVWEKHFIILLRCWVIRKERNSPPPHSSVSFVRVHLVFLATQFGVFSTCKSRQIQAPCGGGLGSPLAGFSPNTGISFFAYFSTSYLTSGPFSCWYFLLLKQRIFWYYFGRLVMAILWCVSQKAASAYEILCFGMLHFLLRFFMQLTS